MACYHPRKAYKTPLGGVTFSSSKGFVDLPFEIPCGQCIGCRLEYSRQWAVRLVHEASLHDSNYFLTLTYNDENLPPYNSLNKLHTQLFIKRLRKKFGSGIRFYLAGEYGDLTNRPHYHAIIFNLSLPDLRFYKENHDGSILRTSAILDRIWGHGECKVGAVSFESAAYVARYVLKKVRGKAASAHYGPRVPEYATMSLKPGIGARWYEKYASETYPSDFIVSRGMRMRPPKSYDKRLEKDDEKLYRSVRSKRLQSAKLHLEDQTKERLLVREEVKNAQISTLKRPIE